MRIINLERGAGKTTRLLYVSWYNQIPILVAYENDRKELERKAKELKLNIPEPITVHDIGNPDVLHRVEEILIDEVLYVLYALLMKLGLNGKVEAVTLSENPEKIEV